MGIARSASGEIWGPWTHDDEPLFAGDGGHCMLFRSKEGKLLMALHSPNTPGMERPSLVEMVETEAGLTLGDAPSGQKGE